ncbi:MAG TPA: response regulator, partial [Anaerolineales bacterium]|nr:response regulator [Anaerolineales bacterium]
MYTLILGKEGHEVTTADDGVKGLAKIREGGWDVVLLDLMMPNMDGLSVLKALQEEPGKCDIGSCQIVILSNAGYSEVAKEAESLGAKGFIMKADMLPKDLIAEIKKYLPNTHYDVPKPAED